MTKTILAEQIQRLYARFLDKDNPSDVIDLREVILLVGQSINKVLKLQVAESFKAGMIDVPKCNLIEYTCPVTAETGNARAYITLPVIPLNLPMDMGIWSIAAATGAMTPYIPIPAQDVLVFQGANLVYLEGKTGYYLQGKKVYFTKNITTTPNGTVTSVIVNLLTMDLSQFGDNDVLPISPEVESAIIADVLETISSGRVSQAELASKQQQ
jgi:hypothetical protein